MLTTDNCFLVNYVFFFPGRWCIYSRHFGVAFFPPLPLSISVRVDFHSFSYSLVSAGRTTIGGLGNINPNAF